MLPGMANLKKSPLELGMSRADLWAFAGVLAIGKDAFLVTYLFNFATSIKHEYLRSRASRCLSLSSSSGVLEIYRDTRAYILDLASENFHTELFISR